MAKGTKTSNELAAWIAEEIGVDEDDVKVDADPAVGWHATVIAEPARPRTVAASEARPGRLPSSRAFAFGAPKGDRHSPPARWIRYEAQAFAKDRGGHRRYGRRPSRFQGPSAEQRRLRVVERRRAAI